MLFGLGWVVGPGWVVPREVGSSARMDGEVSTAAAHASGRPPSVFLASPPSKACAMRSPASSEQRDRPSGLLCGRLLLALVESVLRPGGWESMCRYDVSLCARHFSLDNKHGRSVKGQSIHSFLSRWRAGTELCADKQEEPSGKKGSMGSEKRQKRFRSDLKSVVTLLYPCLLYTSPSPRDQRGSRMPSSA